MKKFFHIIAALIFAAFVLCSCFPQKCPAYAHQESEQSDHNS